MSSPYLCSSSVLTFWSSPADRTQKLKDARSEAAKEIEEIKANKEKEFKAFQQEVRSFFDLEALWKRKADQSSLLFFLQHEGSQSNTQSAVDKDTEAKLKTINEAFEKNNKNVVDKLLQRVTETKAELHRNLQKVWWLWL